MKNDRSAFLALLEQFFSIYLPTGLGASANTIQSYKYAFRLLLEYLYTEKQIHADILLNYGYVGKTTLIFSTPSQVVVTTVDGAGSAGTFYIVVAVFGFDFITADIAPNGVFDDQYEYSFVKSSCIKCAP